MYERRLMADWELDEIIAKHQTWLKSFNPTSNDGMADLRNLDIYHYDFRGADLSYANLSGSRIKVCKMEGVILNGATLTNTSIYRTDMTAASLEEVRIFNCEFVCANLESANFMFAKIHSARFSHCEMKSSFFKGAIINSCDFMKTKTDDCLHLLAPMACPDTGSFIGWKKALIIAYPEIWPKRITIEGIVKLEIPEDARRSSAGGRKCRCDKARVLSITDLTGVNDYTEAFSNYDSLFKYVVGEMVSVDNFDTDRWNECAPGIHFFVNRDEAVAY